MAVEYQADIMWGLSNRFEVIVDELNLGHWASCNGLAVEFQPVEIAELGECEYTQWVPGQVKYGAVSLTRALTKDDSNTTMEWLKTQSKKATGGSSAGDLIGGAALAMVGGIAATVMGKTGSKPAGTATMTIKLLDSKFAEVHMWTLRNAFPKKWSLGALDGSTSKIAIETLELVHEGFL